MKTAISIPDPIFQEYAGQPAFFQIQARLAPSVEVSAFDEGTSMPPMPPGLRPLYAPASGKGTCIYPMIESFSGHQLASGIGDVADLAMAGRDSARRKKLADLAPAGPKGRVLHLWVYGLSPQFYVYLAADGDPWPGPTAGG